VLLILTPAPSQLVNTGKFDNIVAIMSCLPQIAGLNAEALILLQQNKPEQAKIRLVHALRQLQTLCSGAEQEDADTSPAPSVYGDLLGSRTGSFSVDIAFAAQQDDGQDLDSSNHIYKRAFLLTNDIPAYVQETAAVLFFNIGLVHHLAGVRAGKSAVLLRALDFYKRSFGYLGNALDMDQSGTELVVLMGAVCHNMTHCYSTFFQLFKVKDMVEQLTLVVYRMDASEPTSAADYEFFRTSLFFSKWNGSRCSPAA
jgi:hypothetical protein